MHVLGDGELEERRSPAIDAAGLERHVLLHGTPIDMGPWYAACDALLLTSEFEGIPYAIYEAMAMAKPVVAPALPGIAELVTARHGCARRIRARTPGITRMRLRSWQRDRGAP